jgi:hypothetical protein
MLYERTNEAAEATVDDILALVAWGREHSRTLQAPVKSSAPMSTKTLRPLKDLRYNTFNSSPTGVAAVEKEKTAMELAFEKTQQNKKAATPSVTSTPPEVKKPTPAPLPEKRPAETIMQESLRALQAKYQR